MTKKDSNITLFTCRKVSLGFNITLNIEFGSLSMARLYRGNTSPSLVVCPVTNRLETLLVAMMKTNMVVGQPRHRNIMYADCVIVAFFALAFAHKLVGWLPLPIQGHLIFAVTMNPHRKPKQ